MIDKESITHLTLELPKGKTIEVVDEVKHKKRPNYYSVGNGTINRDGVVAMDFIQELIDCSKPAQTVIGWIKDGMKWDVYERGIPFVIKVVPGTNAGKQVLKKGFKELSDKDLVRRVKRGYYMINPHALSTDYSKQLAVWDSCECLRNKEIELPK